MGSLDAVHAGGLDESVLRRTADPVLSATSAVDVVAIEAARVRLAGPVGKTACAFSARLSELLARLRAGGYRVEERENQSGR